MFDLHTLTLFNFRSYCGEHVFEFPTAPGLYSLTGQNLAVPRLGDNGTGKSSLLDAIYWVLYGRTTRGLKAADIIAWGKSTCSVSLTLTVGDQKSTITRGQAPNKLELDGVACDQKGLQDYIRITPEAFLYAVMTPQFGEAFFDLGPAAKLTLFAEILDLRYWVERSEAAEHVLDGIDNDIRSKELSHITRYRNAILLKDTFELTKQSSMEFEQQRTIEIKLLIEKKEGALAARVQILNLLKLDEGAHTTATSLIASNEKKSEKIEYEVAQVRAEIDELSSKISKASAHKETAESQHAALLGIENTCPKCLQSMDEAHKKLELAKLAKLKLQHTTTIEKLLDLKSDLVNEKDELEKKLMSVRMTIKHVRKNQSDFAEKMTGHKVRLASLDEIIATSTQAAESMQKGKNPFTDKVTGLQARLLKEEAKLVTLRTTIDRLKADSAAVSFWVKGFKRIRLMIVDETLQQLELEVNNNLASLGLLDWRITFDVERENKSGGITKGFVVMVHPPHGKPVRFEAYSGGETQRLKLAGDLGLANLIMHRAGLANTIEFYDEPSQMLSDQGVLDLADTLQERALTSGKRIFLIDHQNKDFNFTGRYVVVKDQTGSRLRNED